jgi:hypothetical protein
MNLMRAASTTLLRTFPQRCALVAVVVALVLAPVLANVWPAFGKGEMLYVADGVTAHGDHSSHEGHQATASDSHPSPPHHQAHCALCELAFLGWAPPIDLSLGCTETGITDRTEQAVATTPRLLLLWPGAQARGPPPLS